MAAEGRTRELLEIQEIAEKVIKELGGHLDAMRQAAGQLASGRAPEEVDVPGYQLYLARKNPKDAASQAEAVMCAIEYDQYFGILERAAAARGLCLDDETHLKVQLPDAEFEENMITGGFEKYKGLAIEHHNECLEDLMVAVCTLLKERGLAVACVPDEDVIFYLPIGQN